MPPLRTSSLSTPTIGRWISEGFCCPLLSSYVTTADAVSLILAFHCSWISTSKILATMCLCHLYFHQNSISAIPYIFCFHPTSSPLPYPPSRISVAYIPFVLRLFCLAHPPPYSPLPLSSIPIIPHLHHLYCHPPVYMFQSLSRCLPLSCVLHRHFSLCSCISAMSPPPPFISFPNI